MARGFCTLQVEVREEFGLTMTRGFCTLQVDVGEEFDHGQRVVYTAS